MAKGVLNQTAEERAQVDRWKRLILLWREFKALSLEIQAHEGIPGQLRRCPGQLSDEDFYRVISQFTVNVDPDIEAEKIFSLTDEQVREAMAAEGFQPERVRQVLRDAVEEARRKSNRTPTQE